MSEWREDDWEYFENARTWNWPREPGGQFVMGIFYLALGLPRDVVDIPIGWLDQIPYVTMPISYAYEPVTLFTKPWYAGEYTSGEKRGMIRVPYCKQSKNVIGLTEWQKQSCWVFFENLKTTTFRSPNYQKQTRLIDRYKDAVTKFQKSVDEVEAKNQEIRESVLVELKTQDVRSESSK